MGIFRLQKKLVISIEVAQRVEGGWADKRAAMWRGVGKVNLGRGVGVRELRRRRSAIKAAFSEVLVRRKAKKLVVWGCQEVGVK